MVREILTKRESREQREKKARDERGADRQVGGGRRSVFNQNHRSRNGHRKRDLASLARSSSSDEHVLTSFLKDFFFLIYTRVLSLFFRSFFRDIYCC